MAAAAEVIADYLDEQYVIDTLVDLLKISTEVPMGTDTLMAPDDPKLVHYVQEVVRPELQAIGVYGIIDAPLNQLVVRMGKGQSGKALLIMAYTPSQHSNMMADPLSGRIAMGTEHGFDEPCAFGQGACLLGEYGSVLGTLHDVVVPLAGREREVHQEREISQSRLRAYVRLSRKHPTGLRRARPPTRVRYQNRGVLPDLHRQVVVLAARRHLHVEKHPWIVQEWEQQAEASHIQAAPHRDRDGRRRVANLKRVRTQVERLRRGRGTGPADRLESSNAGRSIRCSEKHRF